MTDLSTIRHLDREARGSDLRAQCHQRLLDELRRDAQRSAYCHALRCFDWSLEFTDDGARYRAQKEQLDKLRQLQRELDPEGEIWNTLAPRSYRLGVPA